MTVRRTPSGSLRCESIASSSHAAVRAAAAPISPLRVARLLEIPSAHPAATVTPRDRGRWGAAHASYGRLPLAAASERNRFMPEAIPSLRYYPAGCCLRVRWGLHAVRLAFCHA